MKNYFLLLIIIRCYLAVPAMMRKYKNLPLEFKVPSNFPDLAYNIVLNPPTEKGFELGKKLFYDGRLSSDGNISCGFCHNQANAFTHHGHVFSQAS